MYRESRYLNGSWRENKAVFQGRHVRVDAALRYAKAGSASPERLTMPPVNKMNCCQTKVWLSQ
eukprot:12921076-Prorocentrum_lima.AAC.1